MIFRPKSEIQTFFRPKSGDLQKKKRPSPKLRVIFRPKSEIQTFFSPKIRWSPKKKKKKVFTEIESDFWPKSEILTFFSSPKIRWSPKKKRSSPKLRVIFRPKSLGWGWWGGCPLNPPLGPMQFKSGLLNNMISKRNHLLYHFLITIHLNLASFYATKYFEKKKL